MRIIGPDLPSTCRRLAYVISEWFRRPPPAPEPEIFEFKEINVQPVTYPLPPGTFWRPLWDGIFNEHLAAIGQFSDNYSAVEFFDDQFPHAIVLFPEQLRAKMHSYAGGPPVGLYWRPLPHAERTSRVLH